MPRSWLIFCFESEAIYCLFVWISWHLWFICIQYINTWNVSGKYKYFRSIGRNTEILFGKSDFLFTGSTDSRAAGNNWSNQIFREFFDAFSSFQSILKQLLTNYSFWAITFIYFPKLCRNWVQFWHFVLVWRIWWITKWIEHEDEEGPPVSLMENCWFQIWIMGQKKELLDVKNEFDERKIRIVGKKVEFLRSTFLNKVRLRGTSPIFRTNLVHPMLLSRNKITKSILKMSRRRTEISFINSIATYPTF